MQPPVPIDLPYLAPLLSVWPSIISTTCQKNISVHLYLFLVKPSSLSQDSRPSGQAAPLSLNPCSTFAGSRLHSIPAHPYLRIPKSRGTQAHWPFLKAFSFVNVY